MNDEKYISLKGQFIVAMPGLKDPNFYRTVTCICEHTSEGAFGVIVNRVHPFVMAADLFRELKIDHDPDVDSLPLHMGGPVQINEVFILHSRPFKWKGCLQVTDTIALTNTRDVLSAIASGNGPESSILTLGCAGWGPGQLEQEIKDNSWLTSPVFDSAIFLTEPENRWATVMEKIGIDPLMLSDEAGRA